MNTQYDCKTCRTHLPDLFLSENAESYAASHPGLAKHFAACTACRAELDSLRSTFILLDEFTAPEPSFYFDSKLHARLREAQAAEPEGFWERLRSFTLFSTGRRFQPALAGALALALVLTGGGTFAGLHGAHSGSHAVTKDSAAVNDLKVLDNNSQAEQQMGQLLDQSGSEDGDGQPTT